MSAVPMPAITMSSQLQGLALYTVEQIELLRRLRNSGINKDQVIQAFDAMDRLDRELGPVYSLPVTLQALQHAAFQRHNLLNAHQAVSVVAANNAAITAAMVAAATQHQQLHSQGQQPTPPQQNQSQGENPATSQNQSVNVSSAGMAVKRPAESPPIHQHIQQLQQQQQQQQQQQLDLSNIHLPNMSNGLFEFPDDGENYIEEYREFISMGEQYCCEQIRNFVIRYSIKQQQIATLAGVSQSYVSRFLKGDVYEMSERSRRAIQKWYIMYRKNPAAIAHAVNAVLITNGSPPKKLAVDMAPSTTPGPNGEYVCYTKRERFVFRPNHLEILERHFTEDNYPSQEKRELISQQCNNATITSAGRPLSEKETVSPQIVGNWFANKRKELKKIAREEGLDVSQVPLRPRGRPCRLLSDLVTMVNTDHSSNHSETASTDNSSHDVYHNAPEGFMHNPEFFKNQEIFRNEFAKIQEQMKEAENNQFPENLSLPRNQDPGSPSLVKNNNDPEENGLYKSNGIARDHHHEEHMNGNDHEVEALSMSVELAAVNQAILSLTGTQPINISKAETPKQTIIKQELATTQIYNKEETALET